jgi:hypothetical protein
VSARAKSRPLGLATALQSFPAGTAKHYKRYVCLACVFQIFTRQLKLAPRTAEAAVRGHTPSLEELTGASPVRPLFDSEETRFPRCPYCGATRGKLALIEVLRIEGNRLTLSARKDLLDTLPKSRGQFQIVEEKASRRDLLFEWLQELGQKFDFDDHRWLNAAAQEYLSKREPKTGWETVFQGLRLVKRSVRLQEGWEREGPCLYLAPDLYQEVLLMQYLVSRSHKSGGVTFEGRLTLPELMLRLRRSGYLRSHELDHGDPLDVLEKLVEGLDPGGSSTKVIFVVDRRDFLTKARGISAKLA